MKKLVTYENLSSYDEKIKEYINGVALSEGDVATDEEFQELLRNKCIFNDKYVIEE